jgi:hypothetical protein
VRERAQDFGKAVAGQSPGFLLGLKVGWGEAHTRLDFGRILLPYTRQPGMRSKHLVLACLGTTALSACDAPDACTPQPGMLFAEVVDPLANPVSIEAAWILQEARTDCMRSGSKRNVVTCMVAKPGATKLVVVAEGVMLERELDVKIRRWDEDYCELTSLERQSFVYEGPACDLSQLIAVQGELYYDADRPADDERAKVEVRSSGGSAECRVQGHSFTCPATSFYASDYTVIARLGPSRIERSTTVAIANCAIEAPAELRIDRSERLCANDDRGTISVFVTERTPDHPDVQNVLPDEVRSSDHTGSWSDCQLAPQGERPAPRPFVCTATTLTGGGAYVLEVTRGGRSEKLVAFFEDDGCKVEATISVRLEEGRFCDMTECAPAGELLNPRHVCSGAMPNTSDLPSCAAQ